MKLVLESLVLELLAMEPLVPDLLVLEPLFLEPLVLDLQTESASGWQQLRGHRGWEPPFKEGWQATVCSAASPDTEGSHQPVDQTIRWSD